MLSLDVTICRRASRLGERSVCLLLGVLRALLLVSLLSPRGQCIAEVTSGVQLSTNVVKFHLLGSYGVVIPVWVDGCGPYNFLLDTGTTVTMVDRALAAQLKIQPISHGAVSSLVQKIPVSIGVASSISFGSITTSPREVLIRDLKGLRTSDQTVLGVLGQNALEDVDFLLDYSRKRLEIDADGSIVRQAAGVRHPLLAVPLSDNSSYYNQAVCIGVNEPSTCSSLMLMDSGSASVVLFQNARPFGIPSRAGYVQDAAGDRQPTTIYQIHLCLQDLCRNLDAQATSFADRDRRVQGLLPTILFNKLYVSNRHKFIIPEPAVAKSAMVQ